ncbi:MAG: hypothetical protein KN64_05915 [Sulfurovum sp. AS07-7]|nr:MAG: hypothetical protein KN64_05915 [Sulfurovum sp. AS07-7]
MNQDTQLVQEDEIDLGSLFKVLKRHKYGIAFITAIFVAIAWIFLYFQPSIYSAYTLLEVRGKKAGVNTNDFLAQELGGMGAMEKVDREMEILKTLDINKKALNAVNYQVRYYEDDGLKKIESYENIPIDVKDIKVESKELTSISLKLTPARGGFYLSVSNTIKDRLGFLTVSSDLLDYDKLLEINGFKFKIQKIKNFNTPIYFMVYGNYENFFDSMVAPNLSISQLNKNASIIKIEYKDNLPPRAIKYVDALTQSFIAESVKDKSSQNNKIIDFIDTQLISIKEKLKETETELEAYQAQNNLVQPSVQAETLIKELSALDIKLSENEFEGKLIDSLSEFVENNKQIDAIAPSLMELNDKPTLELITQLQSEQLKEDSLNVEYTSNHPEVIKNRELTSTIRKKILQNVKNLKGSVEQKADNLNGLKAKYESMLQVLPNQEKDLINLKRDYQVNSNMYEYLLKKKSENEIIKVSVESDYKKIADTRLGSGIVSPKRSMILAVSAITGLIFGIFYAFIYNFIDNKIRNKEDIESQTHIPIYGILPKFKDNDKIEVFSSQKSPFAEAYRSLRTNLQFTLNKDSSNVILVTSTMPSEGKTTTSANLAGIFQMANIRTIVINLDIRKPMLHKLFDVSNTQGMSKYLSGDSSIDKAIQHTQYENLDIISAGPIPPNPSELLLSDRLASLIDELKKRYQVIIIDTPPLGLVSDTFMLMEYADINLVVFRESHAKKDFVRDLDKFYKEHPEKKMGIILNGSHMESGSSYGYGGYGYGYGGYGYGHDEVK